MMEKANRPLRRPERGLVDPCPVSAAAERPTTLGVDIEAPAPKP
jgi:hypothetical protein